MVITGQWNNGRLHSHNVGFLGWNNNIQVTTWNFEIRNCCSSVMQVHVSCLYVENEIESWKTVWVSSTNLSNRILRDKIMLFLHYTQSSVDQSNQAGIDLISIHFLLAVKKENNFKIGVKQFSYSFRSGYESLGLANLDCIMNLSLPIGIKLLKRWNFCRDWSFLL